MRFSRSAESSDLTVACVPTGTKTGVSIWPWGVVIVPARAKPLAFSSLNWKLFSLMESIRPIIPFPRLVYTSRVLKLSDFDYSLPEGAIAQTPAQPRDSSKLLVLDRQTGAIKHAHFSDLPQFLRAGDVLVRNNSKVIKARLFGEKTSGGKVEVLLNTEVRHDEQSVTWECLTKPGLKAGQQQMFGNSLKAECVGAGKAGYTRLLCFDCPSHVFFEIVEKIGQVP
ncbi:MAG: hypothetical protein COU66_03450, partial [Candidatus Pacebacteria bacterium CG10_big_fil_rev_8_21_14_0_10_44_11]